jgi:hypothetical protein
MSPGRHADHGPLGIILGLHVELPPEISHADCERRFYAKRVGAVAES